MRSALSVKTRIALALAACAALAGCTTKSGLSWVNQPEPGVFDGPRAELAAETAGVGEPAEPAAPRPEEGQVRASGRLTRTVSLGQTLETRDSVAPPEGQPRTVVVQLDSYGRPAVYGIVGALEPVLPDEPVLIDPDPIVVQPNPPAGAQPGRDWPAPPSFGPPFPFRPAPAPPFEPAR